MFHSAARPQSSSEFPHACALSRLLPVWSGQGPAVQVVVYQDIKEFGRALWRARLLVQRKGGE